jgi:hypothetical protein
MADHIITAEKWTQCEESLTELDGGCGALFGLWDAAAHGGCFDTARAATALHFIATNMERQVRHLQQLLDLRTGDPPRT